MDTIKNWLELAKQHHLQVINEVSTADLSLCVNLLSIPTTNTIAVTITFMKNSKKKNAAPPHVFARVLRTMEHLMQGVDDEGYKISDHFQPVGLSTQWYHTLNCHRIFFITESAASVFIAELIKQRYLQVIMGTEIREVRLIADTRHYQFNIKF